MSKLAKKFASIATAITVVAMVVGPVAPAQAQTVAELQAQVAALQAQLATLLAQLGSATGGTTGTTGTLPAGCASFDRNLKQGMSGADVKCLQQVLNSDPATQVAASGVGSAGNETMYFGALTTAAVKKYQVKQGIVAVGTGFVGTLTRAKLNAGGTGTGTGTGTVVPTTGVVSVSLASDNPASATIVADTTPGEGAQSMIPVLKVALSNGTASPISVTSMKFTRSGISADTDISQAYLYDGDTKLAEYNSFSLSVLTFNNLAGVLTIPANSVKTITLKVDLVNGATSGKTIRFGINSASDIVSSASSIAGAFPIVGNFMSTATTGDLGKLTVAVQATNPATPDPGEGVEVMKFTLASADQKIEVRRLVFSNIGSVAYTDLTNFVLMDAAIQVGSTVASANSDKTVVMNLSTPLVIEKGTTKNMTLKADIAGGTNRTYQFSFQEMADIVGYDTQYGIYVKPNQSNSWTVLSGASATIQTGKVTASRSADSPSGNISASSTNVVLAKYKIKASGEDVRVSDLTLKIYGSIGNVGMYQTSIYYDGAQIGQTTTTMNTGATAGATGGTTFSFGNTLVLPAGVEKVIEIRSDVKRADGGAIPANSTLTAQISAFTAVGRTSGAAVTIGSVTGFQLTVSAGTLSVAMNQAVPNWTSSVPTGVAGATNVLIGSFILTAGSGEGANITAISMQIASTSAPTTANTEFQNIRIYKGTMASGVQVGSAIYGGGTPVASTTYNVYPSPYLSLNAGEQVVLNIYADILTGADTDNARQVVIGPVYGTGKVTNTAIDSTGWVSGQTAVVSSGGFVAAFADINTPATGLVVMGTTGVEFAKFKISASSSPEAMTISGLVATTTLTSAPVGSVYNLNLTATIDGVASSWTGVTLTGLTSGGVADFTGLMTANPLVIPAGKEAVISLKADVASYPTAVSGSAITFGLATTTWRGESGSPTTIAPAYRVAGNAMYLYKTKPTVSLVAQSSTANTLTNSEIDLLKFTVTADSKDAVNLYSVNVAVDLLDINTATDLYIHTIGIYEEGGSGSALNDYVAIATSTNTFYGTASTTAIGSSMFGSGANVSEAGNIKLYKNGGGALKTIGATETKTFIVKATVVAAATVGDSVSTRLKDLSTATANAIVWGDQVSTSIASSYVKTLPTGTWSYSVK